MNHAYVYTYIYIFTCLLLILPYPYNLCSLCRPMSLRPKRRRGCWASSWTIRSLAEIQELDVRRLGQILFPRCCYIMLCYVMLCYLNLCYVMFCFVMLSCYFLRWKCWMISIDSSWFRNIQDVS